MPSNGREAPIIRFGLPVNSGGGNGKRDLPAGWYTAERTMPGRRTSNQDSCICVPIGEGSQGGPLRSLLMAVADGIDEVDGGATASSLAVDCVKYLAESSKNYELIELLRPAMGEAYMFAARKIHEAAETDS